MAAKKVPGLSTEKVMKRPDPPQPSGRPSSVSETDWENVVSERRIKDCETARSIWNKMQNDNLLRSETIVQVRTQLEGGRPYNPKQLEAAGAAWQTNVNFRDSVTSRDRTLTPYWKMVNDVPHKVAVTVESNSPLSDKWQVAFAEAFDDFIDDWASDYFIQYMNFAKNFVDFGPGIVQWPDPDSPRFKSVNVQRILWPKNARMSPDEWEIVGFVRDVSASELFLKIKDKAARKRSEYAGWNMDAVKKAIIYYKNGTFVPDPRDLTRWQDLFVNNDLAVATKGEPLQLVWLFVRQFSGQIGCYVFTQQGGVDDFLFKSDEYAEDFRHVLGAVWYDTGVDSMIHSIKGFGIKNYYYSSLLNRVKSRFVDSVTMSLGINFQRDNENIPDEAPPVENYGPYTIFPPGLTQLNVYPQIQQGYSLISMLEQNEAENNSLYRDQQRTQIAETDTAKQAEILAGIQAEMTEASASMFLAQMGESVFSECFRKLRRRGNQNEDAKKFVERLRLKGVPDKAIHNIPVRIKTGANSGLANPILRTQKYREGMAIASQRPGWNARWFDEQYVANQYGANAINKALLPEGSASRPAARREAMIENQMFGDGQPLPVAPSDAHMEHIEEHLKPLEQIAGQFQQTLKVSPEQAMALTIGIEHTGAHMGFLQQDETQKQAFQALNPKFRQIQSIARGILTRLSSEENNPQAPSPIAMSA